MRRSDHGLDQVDLLGLRPVRLAGWNEVEGRVVVERPRPLERGLRGLAARLSHWTGVPRLRLDALGGAAWRRFDGAATVGVVCAALRAEFGEGCEPAEERLRLFLAMLRRENLIAYPGWDDEAIARWRSHGAAAAAGPPRAGAA